MDKIDDVMQSPQAGGAPFAATWRERLPEDEIGRQQDVIDRLKPGCVALLAPAPGGVAAATRYRYGGVWDTWHMFYPADAAGDRSLLQSPPAGCRCRRDIRGCECLAVPYTILSELVVAITD
ncbi:MAG: hypothetical protein K2L83_08560 [Muribaculaceae bacterium]|nr:hypothetical protein [Muribaculaceae bacterium]